MPRKAGPGRPRKPVEQKVLDGTYRADRDGPLTDADRPEPPPDKPAGLGERLVVVWDELMPALAGVVKARDVAALADLCRWAARLRRIAERVDATDPAAPGFKNLLVAAGIATDKVALWSVRFGLSPADRAKLRPETTGPAKAKVKTRPATKIDTQGAPHAAG